MADPRPTLRPDPSPLSARSPVVSLQRRLFPRGAQDGLGVYALVDGASASELLTVLRELRVDGVHCLHGRTLEGAAARAAPYLIRLEQGAPFVDWLTTEGWGESWGIYLRSAASPEHLLQHLRGFRKVLDPGGDELHLRFYDPRSLRVLVPGLDDHSLARLFGGVLCADGEGVEVRRCPLCDGELGAKELRCPGCRACFTSPDGGPPWLIHSILAEGRSPWVLETFRPWRSEEERAVAAAPSRVRRDLSRGRTLALSDEQLTAFGEDLDRRDYVAWAIEHLAQVFPSRCSKLGPWGVRDAIWFAWERARCWGLRSPVQVTRYLDVMFLWDPAFEEHREGPWRAVLEDADLAPQAKADRLWEVAREQVAAIKARLQGSAP